MPCCIEKTWERNLKTHPETHSTRSGQSFISLVFLIGGMVAVIGVLLTFFTSAFIDSGYGYQSSANAQAAATSGAEDALLQLDRNPSFATSSYSLATGSTTATISVTQNSPSANFITVVSAATVAGRTGKVSVVLAKNASTSQTTVLTWQETQ